MRLTSKELEALRDALAGVHESQGAAIPWEALVRLTAAIPKGVGLTVDFDAAAVLGSPVVVLRPTADPDPCFDELTPREREVASLLAVGLRNKDIALALGIRLGTVKDHVHHILTKTGLDSRAAVAARFSDSGD